jgi:hypothetical protein
MYDTLASALAGLYQRGEHTEPTPHEEILFGLWLNKQFDNIPHPVRFTKDEVSPERLLHTFIQTGDLLISAANNQSVWSHAQNLMFRAVHDYHHIKANASFNMIGEIQAYGEAAKVAPKSIHWILFSEIVLQAATAIHTGTFPVQKLVKL